MQIATIVLLDTPGGKGLLSNNKEFGRNQEFGNQEQGISKFLKEFGTPHSGLSRDFEGHLSEKTQYDPTTGNRVGTKGGSYGPGNGKVVWFCHISFRCPLFGQIHF